MDTAERPHSGIHGCPLVEATVVSLLQQVLASAVVRKLIEDPGAILHTGRVDLPEVPAVGQVVHIFSALQHLAAEVRPFVDTNSESSRGLQGIEQDM